MAHNEDVCQCERCTRIRGRSDYKAEAELNGAPIPEVVTEEWVEGEKDSQLISMLLWQYQEREAKRAIRLEAEAKKARDNALRADRLGHKFNRFHTGG